MKTVKGILVVWTFLALTSIAWAAVVTSVVGDKDGFHPGDPTDLPLQSPHVQALIAFLTADPGQSAAVPLDVDGVHRPVGLTHVFALPPQALLTAATLTFRVRGGEMVYNDGIFYTATGIPSSRVLPLPVIALRDLLGREPQAGETLELEINLSKVPVRTHDTTNGPGGRWSPYPDEFRNLLPLLLEGTFDLVFADDLTVDFSELHITYVLPSAPRGELTDDGVIDQRDLKLLFQALNTTASPNDPRDVDHDGRITALDARQLVLLCTKPRCANQVIETRWDTAQHAIGNWTEPNWRFMLDVPGSVFPQNHAQTYNVMIHDVLIPDPTPENPNQTQVLIPDVTLDVDATVDTLTATNGNLTITTGHTLTTSALGHTSTLAIHGPGSRLLVRDAYRDAEGTLRITERGTLRVDGRVSNAGFMDISGPGSFLQMGSYRGGADIAILHVGGGAVVTTLQALSAGRGEGDVSVSGPGSTLTAHSFTHQSSQGTMVNEGGLLRVFTDYNQQFAHTSVCDMGRLDIGGAYNLLSEIQQFEDIVNVFGAHTHVCRQGVITAEALTLHAASQLIVDGGVVEIRGDSINMSGEVHVTGGGSSAVIAGNFIQRPERGQGLLRPPDAVTDVRDGGMLIVGGQLKLEGTNFTNDLTVQGYGSMVHAGSYFLEEDTATAIRDGARLTTKGDFIAVGDAAVRVTGLGSVLAVGGDYNEAESTVIQDGGMLIARRYQQHGITAIQTGGRVIIAEVFYSREGNRMEFMSGGILTTKELITEGGQILVRDGGLQVGGNLDNPEVPPGKLSVEPGGQLTAYGELLPSGNVIRGIVGDVVLNGGRIAPGSPAGGFVEGRIMAVDGAFVFHSGTLSIEVAGTQPPDLLERGDFDRVHITGAAHLEGGTTLFVFTNSFRPTAGDTLQFLTAGGGITVGQTQFRVQGVAPGFQCRIQVMPTALVLLAVNTAVPGPGPELLCPVE